MSRRVLYCLRVKDVGQDYARVLLLMWAVGGPCGVAVGLVVSRRCHGQPNRAPKLFGIGLLVAVLCVDVCHLALRPLWDGAVGSGLVALAGGGVVGWVFVAQFGGASALIAWAAIGLAVACALGPVVAVGLPAIRDTLFVVVLLCSVVGMVAGVAGIARYLSRVAGAPVSRS